MAAKNKNAIKWVSANNEPTWEEQLRIGGTGSTETWDSFEFCLVASGV